MSEMIETLLGLPLESPAVVSFLADAGYSDPAPQPKHGYIFLSDHGINLQTAGEADAQHLKRVTLIFEAYSGPLPYRLDENSDRTAVEAALGSPDFVSPHPGRDGIGMQYLGDEIAIWINVVDGAARDVAVWTLDASEKAMARRLSNPSTYGAPPKASSVDAVRAFRTAPFLTDWRTRDTLLKFRDPYLHRIENGLDAFIDVAINASEHEDMAALLSATRDFVELVNAVNVDSAETHDEPMIETLERDELGVFVDDVLKATGARFEEGDDVTMPWREW